MVRRVRRLTSLLPVLLVLAACGGSEQPPRETPPSATSSPRSTTSSPPSTTSSAAPAKPTLASLAEQPCQALGQEDTTALNVFVEGSEVPDPSGKTCSWGAQGALVQFTAYPAADKTQDAEAQNLTVSEIEGRRALLGEHSRSGRTGYTILVATGPGQSFRIMTVGWGEGTPGPDALTVGKNFAAAVLRRLG